MEIVEQRHQILTDVSSEKVAGMFHLMELAGRTCYKSEDKIGYIPCECNKLSRHDCCDYFHWHKEDVLPDGRVEILVPSAFPFIAKILKFGHESVIEHVPLSIKFITDRGVTHELVRHKHICAA